MVMMMVMMMPSSPSSKIFFLTFSPDHGMQISFLEEKKFWIFFGDDGDGDDGGDDEYYVPSYESLRYSHYFAQVPMKMSFQFGQWSGMYCDEHLFRDLLWFFEVHVWRKSNFPHNCRLYLRRL